MITDITIHFGFLKLRVQSCYKLSASIVHFVRCMSLFYFSLNRSNFRMEFNQFIPASSLFLGSIHFGNHFHMEKQEEYPLTSGQRWIVHRWETNSGPSGPVPRIYLLTKDFNYSAFVKAINIVVSSHPSLRLKLTKRKYGWRQSFPDTTPFVCDVKVKGLFKRTHVKRIIAGESRRVYDLRSDTPVRAVVLRVNKKNILSLCIDHAAVDAISIDVFEKHLLEVYQKLIMNVPIHSSPSEAFLGFLAREISTQEVEDRNLEYWKKELKELPKFPFLGLKPSNIGYVFRWNIKDEEFQTIKTFCLERKCTLYTLMVVLQLRLLSEARGIDEIVLNIIISNRIRPEDREIIGNIFMPLRVRFSVLKNEPIPEFLGRVQQKIWDAMLHRQYDYPSLQDFLICESRRTGYSVGFTCSCNFIVDDGLTFPNPLFVKRLDQSLVKFYPSVLEGTFSFRARQFQSSLSFEIIWDAKAWPISPIKMPSTFIHTLRKVYTSS